MLGFERVNPGIVPDVGAVSAMLSELKVVDMLSICLAIDTNQFMLTAVEGAHAAVVFNPDAELAHGTVNRNRCRL